MKWYLTADDPGKVCLLQGNEAIVRGAVEAGINFAASYPGSPSSQVLGMLGEIAEERGFYAEWSANEICAIQACFGASLANARSICVVKQNGLFLMADALHCGAQHGVKGGLVIVTSDDPDAHSSTNEFDSRHTAKTANIPMLEPTTIQEAKDMVPYAFELSEKLRQVVIIRLTTRVCHGRSNVALGELPKEIRKISNVGEWDRLTCVNFMHKPMLDKLDKAEEIFETCEYNRIEGPDFSENLVICGGTGRLYAKEAIKRLGAEEKVTLMSLATIWPIPKKYVLDRMKAAKRVLVVEEVDPVIEDAIAALAGREGINIKIMGRGTGDMVRIGELNQDKAEDGIRKLLDMGPRTPDKPVADLPAREMNFCAGCPHRATFYVLKRVLRMEKVYGCSIGDIGCYFMQGQNGGFYSNQMDNCMGSGINVAEGLGQLTKYGLDQKVITVCGDSTFFHSIIPGLISAKFNMSNVILMILDNSATAMTGFQPHPGCDVTAMGKPTQPISIEAIVRAIGIEPVVADPFDIDDAVAKLRGLTKKDGTQVIIMRQPCATLMSKRVKVKKRVYVDQRVCFGDDCGCNRFCSRVWGCPGNSWDFKAGKAVIDTVSCVGCGVCAKLCPSGAIKVEGGEE